MTFAGLTDKEVKFLENNSDVLEGIYKKRIVGITDEVLSMERGEERADRMDLLSLLRDEYKAMGMFSSKGKSKPERFT